MAEIKYIPVKKLWQHPDNPRKDLGDVSELAESIKVNGVLQNLTVVPLIGEITKKWDGESYRVIIGHRRLAAAKLAGLEELPCVVVEMSEREQLSTMLTENMQRSDLAAIVWIRTPGGKSMPCDATPRYYIEKPRSGSKKIVTPNGEVISCEYTEDPHKATGTGFAPHWGSCRAAGSFKSREEHNG